jgi:hypothetical protein
MATKRMKKAARRTPAAPPAKRKAPRKTAAPKKKVKETVIEQVFLEPEEFIAICHDALGGRGWQRAFMSGTGMAQSTITRYIRGVFPIPQYVAMICRMLQTLRINGIPLPEEFTVPGRSARDE